MQYQKNISKLLGIIVCCASNLLLGQTNKPTRRILPVVKPVTSSVVLPGKSSKIETRSLKSEINFWLDRFKDHLIYLKQGLGDSNVNKDLMQRVNNFKKQISGNEAVSKSFLNKYNQFLNELEKYNQSAVEKSKNNKVLHPLAKHTLEETQYHKQNVNGKERSYAEEVKFWTKHDKDVATLKSLKLTATAEEKKLLTKLEQLGINQHENKEDRYAKARMAKKRQ